MIDLIRRIPLLARVTIALALVAILPLGYAVWSLYDVNRAGMHEQVLRTHAVAASTAAERIAGAVATRSSFARTLAGNAAITVDPRSPSGTQFLQELLAADPAIALVEITDPSGEIVVRAQRRGAAEQTDLAVHGAGSQAVTFWTVGAESWLLVAEPLGEGRGSLRVLSEGSAILEALDPAEIGDQAQMILASTRNELLAGSAPLATFPPAMIETARSARINGTGIYRDTEGREIMGAFAPVTGTNWFVLSRQPSELAQEIAVSMRRRAAIAVAVALALAMIITFIAHRSVVRPIREVVAAQRRLAGNTPLPSGSEIEQLRVSSGRIERRINDQEDLGRVFLGRYHALGIIGQGGMGTVFRGWDPKLRRHVALKTIRFGEMQPERAEELVDSLVAEAISGASVNHPNIVSVYDVEDSPSAAFIAMELVEGVSLQTYLDQRGTMRTDGAAHVGLAVARALEAAHARSLLHRDIKPANVLLAFDGSMKVTDFGLAALMSTMSASPNMVFGTPGYIPPEAATGSPVDTRADLFALGVVLYQCVTGANPFDRDTSRETMIATVVTSPPPLAVAAKGNGVLHDLSDLVGQLMQKLPKNRPDSATAVAEALERMIQTHKLHWKLDVEGEPPPMTGHSPSRLVATINPGRSR